MQCYERQAMHLQLYSDAITEIPELEFDPVLLDEVLSDSSIVCFKALIELDKRQRREIMKCIRSSLGLITEPREITKRIRSSLGLIGEQENVHA